MMISREFTNVVYADFSDKFLIDTYHTVKFCGIDRTERMLIDQGHHPSFAKAIIRKIMRTLGW